MSFVEQFADYGDRPALVFPGGRTISYAELSERVARLAGELGDEKRLIGLEAEKSEQAIIAYLAALKGGHAVALLPPGDADALEAFKDDFSPDAIFRRFGGRWRRIEAPHGTAGGPHPDLAVLLATSGSTGRSRFVRLSARAIEANARSIASYLGLTEADRAALLLPIHYSYGLSVLNSHLSRGASVYLAGRGVAETGFVEELRGALCTTISGVPYSYELMEKTGFLKEDLPSLRFMTVAGGRIAPDLAEKFRSRLASRNQRFFVMYGQTEATARIAYVPPESLAGNCDAIGVAIPGGSLRLVDEAGRTVSEPGHPGELVYRGPNVMMGYAERRADLARGHEVEDLRTGDIATCDEHGFYRIVGRAKRMSKIAGLRVNHEAVEAVLARQGIAAAVLGDDRWLQVMSASPRDERQVLRAAMAATGLSAMHIGVRRVEALPRLPSGKVDYQRLRSTGADGATPHRGDEAADVLAVFRRAFYPRAVREADSFESLGGDSLVYVQLSMALERLLGRPPEGWEKLSIGELRKAQRSIAERRQIGSELLLRAVAILTVVVHHATLWPIPGGAATLMMMVGYGLARFQAAAMFAGDRSRLLKGLAINLAVYAPIVAGFCLARGDVLWPSILLAGNLGLTGPDKMLPYLYWFVEAYAQIILLVAGLFSIASVRRAVRSKPLQWGLIALTATVALKLATPLLWNVGPLAIFTVPDVLYLAVLGWCVHYARSRSDRLIVFCAAAMILPFMAYWGGNWIGSWVKFGLVLGSVGLLLYLPRVSLPVWLTRLILPVAAASYHIYLFHRILPDIFLPQPDPLVSQPIAACVSVVGGVLVGLAAYRLQGRVIAWLAERRVSARDAMAPAE